MAQWNIPVEDDLDKAAFEAAHEIRMSKSQFVREAVQEKIMEVIREDNPIMKKIKVGNQIVTFPKSGYIPPQYDIKKKK